MAKVVWDDITPLLAVQFGGGQYFYEVPDARLRAAGYVPASEVADAWDYLRGLVRDGLALTPCAVHYSQECERCDRIARVRAKLAAQPSGTNPREVSGG